MTDLVIGIGGLQGPPGINWRSGGWVSSATYAPYDAVAHNGSSWIALQSNQNVEPGTAPLQWEPLALSADLSPDVQAEIAASVNAAAASASQAGQSAGTAQGAATAAGQSAQSAGTYAGNAQQSAQAAAATAAALGVRTYDVVVYGANPGGIMAAISAARYGMKVALISERPNVIGGMAVNGISNTDVTAQYTTGQVRGLGNRYYARLAQMVGVPQSYFMGKWHYGAAPWKQQLVMNEMLAESPVTIHRNEQLLSVAKTGTTVTSITTTGATYNAKVFIDGSYGGDLLAMSSITTIATREANSQYGENYNGWTALTNVAGSIDPYVTPATPASGLLPGISSVTPGTAGTAAAGAQAAWYRMFWQTGSNKIAFPATPPAGYSAATYEMVGRYFAANGQSWTLMTQYFNVYTTIDGYDINGGQLGTEWTDPQVTEWITATPARRLVIEQNCKNYVLGLIYFLQTDSRVPAAFKTNLNTYGFDSRAWAFNGGFPPQMYMREARRMVGDYVYSETGITTANGSYTDPVALTYYGIDCHIFNVVNNSGVVATEGTIAQTPSVGQSIPMRVLFPKVADCTNVMPTFCVSASHVAFCAIRLEPISMMFGDAAGAIAAWAVETGNNVQSIPYATLDQRLNIFGHQVGSGAILSADGTTLNGGTVTSAGTWTTSAGFYGPGTILTGYASVAVGSTRKFQPNIREAGYYDVYILAPTSNALKSKITPVTIQSNGTVITAPTLDQNLPPTNTNFGSSGDWDFLGSYYFAAGTPSADYVQIGVDGAGGKAGVTAIAWLPRGSRSAQRPIAALPSGQTGN